MNDMETFDLLLAFVQTKNGNYVSLPPSIQLLLIEKFDCELNVFEKSFPFFPIE